MGFSDKFSKGSGSNASKFTPKRGGGSFVSSSDSEVRQDLDSEGVSSDEDHSSSSVDDSKDSAMPNATINDVNSGSVEDQGGVMIPLLQHEKELSEKNDKILRIAAEMDNMKRRSDEQLAKLRRYDGQFLMKDLTVALEYLYLAMSSAEGDQSNDFQVQFSNLKAGLSMTINEMEKVFEQKDVERIYPLGQKFDPTVHQAMSEREVEGSEGGVVLQVAKAGYRIKDLLISPALVIVSKAKS